MQATIPSETFVNNGSSPKTCKGIAPDTCMAGVRTAELPVLTARVQVMTDKVTVLTDELPVLTAVCPVLTDDFPVITFKLPALTAKLKVMTFTNTAKTEPLKINYLINP